MFNVPVTSIMCPFTLGNSRYDANERNTETLRGSFELNAATKINIPLNTL